jgi:hypothetical protein
MKKYVAVSNLTWQGLPPAQGRPCDEETFRDIKSCKMWLQKLGCGGVVSDGDKIVAWIPPGS